MGSNLTLWHAAAALVRNGLHALLHAKPLPLLPSRLQGMACRYNVTSIICLQLLSNFGLRMEGPLEVHREGQAMVWHIPDCSSTWNRTLLLLC